MASIIKRHQTAISSISETSEQDVEPADTIIISAKEESFYEVFLGEWCWYPIRIGTEKLKTVRWIAVYQTAPISAITHFARIDQIVDYLETGRYKIVFGEPEELPHHVTLGVDRNKTLQGQRYTTMAKLKKALVIDDLKPWN
jgi:hypothetical protein